LLLRYGIADHNGRAPPHLNPLALSLLFYSCAALLLHAKADPNARDRAGRSPLATATAKWLPALPFEERYRLAIARECAAGGGGGWCKGDSTGRRERSGGGQVAGGTFLTDDKEGQGCGVGTGGASGRETVAAGASSGLQAVAGQPIAAAAAGAAAGTNTAVKEHAGLDVGAAEAREAGDGAGAMSSGGDGTLSTPLHDETDTLAGSKKGKKGKRGKKGGSKGGKRGKGKTVAGMAADPVVPPDAIGLAVLLLGAGADPRIEEGSTLPRWLQEVCILSGVGN
jgi:hypothetical protein